MFGWLKSITGSSKPRRAYRAVHVPVHVRGRYDAAATTDENRRQVSGLNLQTKTRSVYVDPAADESGWTTDHTGTNDCPET
jgi:hypothetical protein